MDVQGLRGEARKYINGITADDNDDSHILWATSSLAQYVETKSLSLEEIATTLHLSNPDSDIWQDFEKLLVLDLYLSSGGEFHEDPSSHFTTAFVRAWVARAILPTKAFAKPAPYATDEGQPLTDDDIARLRKLGVRGLGFLSHLQERTPLTREESTVDVYTCLASYSNPSDPWTATEACNRSQTLVEKYDRSESLPAILTDLLKNRVKPLFAKAKNPAITAQGRKAIDPRPNNDTAHSDLDTEAKPWKYRGVYIVTVFQWILQRLNETSVEVNWPLLIPPLLALIDDSSIEYKVTGCDLLVIFLRSCPSSLLERTGLGEVFENALMPCLLYLPSLTEEADSLRVLKASYSSLMSLSNVRFADRKHRTMRMKALNKVLRRGILQGYALAGDHVRIAELLLDQMTGLTNEMGAESVNSLKSIIPLLSSNLASPFATAYPPLLRASLEALHAIIVNAWPRISYHRSEVLKGLTVFWCRVEDDIKKPKDLLKLQEMVEKATRLLTSVVRRDVDVDVEMEYQVLTESEPRLRNLLTV